MLWIKLNNIDFESLKRNIDHKLEKIITEHSLFITKMKKIKTHIEQNEE